MSDRLLKHGGFNRILFLVDRSNLCHFPGRAVVPKTLIFAKDDAHAEEIVTQVREVFGKGNDFAAKITYTARNAETRLAAFPTLQQVPGLLLTGTGLLLTTRLRRPRDEPRQPRGAPRRGRW